MTLRQAKWKFDKDRKIWQVAELEEHVVREITERLWFQARIKVWRIRERIPDKRKKWQQLSTAGIPDLIGFIPRNSSMQSHATLSGSGLMRLSSALPLFIECKRPGKNVRRPAQEEFITEAKRGGCVAFFAESWADVVKEFAWYGLKLEG